MLNPVIMQCSYSSNTAKHSVFRTHRGRGHVFTYFDLEANIALYCCCAVYGTACVHPIRECSWAHVRMREPMCTFVHVSAHTCTWATMCACVCVGCVRTTLWGVIYFTEIFKLSNKLSMDILLSTGIGGDSSIARKMRLTQVFFICYNNNSKNNNSANKTNMLKQILDDAEWRLYYHWHKAPVSGLHLLKPDISVRLPKGADSIRRAVRKTLIFSTIIMRTLSWLMTKEYRGKP